MPAVRTGVVLALVSALFFGVSGPLAKSLYEIGWTPASAVLFRICGVALLLTVPTLVAMRGRWREARRHWRIILMYGVMSICGVQLLFFAAVENITVGVALLIEYTAPVLVVLFLWLTTRRRPGALTLAGVAVAMLGLVLVLDLGSGVSLNPVGLAFAVAAAACLASYFIIGAKTTIDIPQVALIGIGMWIGFLTVGTVSLVRLLPSGIGTGQAPLGGVGVAWWLPAVALVVTTLLAYVSGLAAMRLLGATMGSFVALSEVVFAVVVSWAVLGEVPTGVQALGGLAILAGVVVIKLDEARPRVPQPADAERARV